MKDINRIGFIVGVIAWFVIIIFTSTQISCQKFQSCGAGDLILFGIISVGMIAPASIVSLVVSIIFKTKE